MQKREIPKTRLSDSQPKPPDVVKVEGGGKLMKDFIPEPKQNTMKSILKRAGSLIAGVIGFGGSIGAGLDINTAILIGATAMVAIISGEIAFAKEFKELFKDADE